MAYLDCARLREKMADGFGTVSRCGESRSPPPPPNLEGERCLAALRGLGDSLVVAGEVSFGGVGLLVGNAILIGDLERATDDVVAGDRDLPVADLGGSPNRESPPPPPPPPPSLAPCVRLLDLDLDEASEAAFGAPRWTEVTYLTPWLMSPPTLLSHVIGTIYRRTSTVCLSVCGRRRASTSSCICQISVKRMQRVAMTTMTAAAAATILPLSFLPSFHSPSLPSSFLHFKSTKSQMRRRRRRLSSTPTPSPSSIKPSERVYRQIKVTVAGGIYQFTFRG